jgi:CheY-like chemotaxis protein
MLQTAEILIDQPPELTVLVVDDDRAIREALADILQALDYHVVLACDGQHAMSLLNQGCDPNVILLDLGMPTMDGWQFRKELLRDPRFAQIRVVVITAMAGQNAKELQAEAIITKPVQLQRLIEVLGTEESHDANG